MTKVSVFGQPIEEEKKELKKIELKSYLIITTLEFAASPYDGADSFDNVQLLRCSKDNDVILCWMNGRAPAIYIGHWNDGIV